MSLGLRKDRDLVARSLPAPGQWHRRFRNRILVTDAVSVGLAVTIAGLARFSGGAAAESVAGIPGTDYLTFSIVLAVAWLVALAWRKGYSPSQVGTGTEEYRRILGGTTLLFGLMAMFAVMTRADIARGYLAIAFPLGLLLLFLGRWINRGWLQRQRDRGQAMDRALLIGSPHEIAWVAEKIRRSPYSGYQVVAVATGDDRHEVVLEDGTRLRNMGSIEDSVDYLPELGASALIVAGHESVGRKFLRKLSWQLEDTPTELVLTSRMTDVAGPRIQWRPVDGLPLMTVEMPQYSGMKYAVKRAFDVFTASAVLTVLSPLMLAAALAVKLDSPGPVFFRQRRVGVDGEYFSMIKFRSMYVDAEERKQALMAQNEGSGPLFKMRNDPRITTVGRFLRKFSIDELPQILNVIRGDMSLVGPRPQLPCEVEMLPVHQRRRLNVKPGITGPWQVGGRSNLSADEAVRLDLTYVENWSVAGDLVILLKTVRAVLTADGAY